MAMSSANQCRCFQGLRLLTNHEEHEEYEGKADSEISSCPLCPSWSFLKSLRALFEGRRFAPQMGERFTGKMQ